MMNRNGIGNWMMATALAFAGAVSAEDCAWLPVSAIDEALPEFSPWEAYGVGQVRCSFASQLVTPRHSLMFERTYHDTPEAAERAASDMKGALSGLFTPKAEAVLGTAGFSGVADIEGGKLLSLTGHRGRLYVSAKFGFPSGVSDTQRTAGLGLADRVLGTGAQMATTEGLAQCPHLDVGLLAPRWKDASVSLPEAEVCMIRSGTQVLEVAVERQSDPDDLIQYLIEETCTSEPVPALGASARRVFGCGKETRVFFAQGKYLVRLELRTGAESTAEDRAWLTGVAIERAKVPAKQF